jgi:WD40 repeat protein
VVALARSGFAHVCSTDSPQNPRSISIPKENVACIALSSTGRHLASSFYARAPEVSVWDTRSCKKKCVVQHSHSVHSITFSSDERLLATATSDNTIHIWDLNANKELVSKKCKATCLAFAPDSKTLALSSPTGPLFLWTIGPHNPPRPISHDELINLQILAFSPQGTTLAGGDEAGVYLWNTAQPDRVSKPADRPTDWLAFAPDGKTLASTGMSRIDVTNLTTGHSLLDSSTHSGSVDHLALTTPTQCLVSKSTFDETAMVWDLNTYGCRKSLRARHCIMLAEITSQGLLLHSSRPGAIELVDLNGAQRLREFHLEPIGRSQEKPRVVSLGFLPEEEHIVSLSSVTSSDGLAMQVDIWNENGKRLVHRRFFTEGIAKLTPSGREILHLSPMGRPVLEGTASGDVEVEFSHGLGPPFTFSPDGKLLASWMHAAKPKVPPKPLIDTSGPTLVCISETMTGRELRRIEVESNVIVSFCRDSRLLAIADAAGISMVDILSGRVVSRLAKEHSDPLVSSASVSSIAFLSKDHKLAIGLVDGTILVLDIGRSATWVPSKPTKRAGLGCLEQLWKDLASAEPKTAYSAMSELAAVEAEAVPYLRDKLRPVESVSPNRILTLIKGLDSDEFATRSSASKQLMEIGEQVEPHIRKYLLESPSTEGKRRAHAVLKDLAKERYTLDFELIRKLRAIQVLRWIGSKSSRDLLAALAGGAPDATLTKHARDAIRFAAED